MVIENERKIKKLSSSAGFKSHDLNVINHFDTFKIIIFKPDPLSPRPNKTIT